jgi:hypothetical protein
MPTWLAWTIKIAVVAAYFWILEYFWGWKQLLAPWQSISYLTIFAAVVLLSLTYFIRAWRIYDYFRTDIAGNYILTLKLTLLHNVLNNLLPARSGEVSFPLLMKRYFQVSLTRSAGRRIAVFHYYHLPLVAGSDGTVDNVAACSLSGPCETGRNGAAHSQS